MTRDELELVPEQVNSGRITWKQAVNDLIIFIIRNKPMFGLTKYDEDFVSEVIINFLDRGVASLSAYESDKGAFFNYVYCFTTNICNSIKKIRASKRIIEHHTINESIANYNSTVEAYANINYEDLERPIIPYKYTPVSYKDFQIACQTDSYHISRVVNTKNNNFARTIKAKLQNYSPSMIQNIIMVLALKSAYYITEEQIETISETFNIDSVKFHQVILEIKQLIEPRKMSRKLLEERRNRAYFLHNKTRNLMEWNNCIKNDADYCNLVLKKSYKKNTTNWYIYNSQLRQGKILVRPTTKLIAMVLGLSTRQVTYYQTTARKLGIDISKV